MQLLFLLIIFFNSKIRLSQIHTTFIVGKYNKGNSKLNCTANAMVTKMNHKFGKLKTICMSYKNKKFGITILTAFTNRYQKTH